MEQLLEFIRGIDPILLSALAFLVGTLVGNWIAIGRDRRQEFNAAVKPVRAVFLALRDNPNPFLTWPSNAEIDHIQHYMWPWRRRLLRAAIDRYQQRHHEQMVQDKIYGSVSYADAAVMSKCANKVLAHLQFR